MQKERISNMITFCKTILSKVSFDEHLLRKEYYKCLDYLSAGERPGFKRWVRQQPFYQKIYAKSPVDSKKPFS